MARYRAINIFGLPFAGSDTHGHELAQLFDAPLLSSGEVFRSSVRSYLRKISPRSILAARHHLMFLLKLFTPYFKKPEFTGRPLILSSVGRWIGEEQIIQAAEESGHSDKSCRLSPPERSNSVRTTSCFSRNW